MNANEIAGHIEHIEAMPTYGVRELDFMQEIGRAFWEIAYQLAKVNDRVERNRGASEGGPAITAEKIDAFLAKQKRPESV